MNRQRNVIIVRPEPSRALGAFYRNLGLTMLATHLRDQGVATALADLTFETLADKVAPAASYVALFSLYIDDFSRGMQIAGQLKNSDPSSVTAVGGPHVTLLGPKAFNIGDAFDLLCVGDCLPEAIPVIAELAAGKPRQSRGIITAPSDKARMDMITPDYSIWPAGRYFPVFPIEMSRGCRQRCPFCTDPVLRRGLALDPVEQTMKTIRILVHDHGRIWVRFVDSSLTSLGDDLTRVLDELIAANLPVEWSAYGYPHDITEHLAQKMAAAGCVGLFLGIESLGRGVMVGKHHTKRPEEVGRAIDALHDCGIFVHGNFIVGLPGETHQTVAQTQNALSELQLDSIGGGPFFLTPGSTFDRAPRNFGIEILDPDWALRQHVNFYDSDYEYFRTSTLSQSQIRRLASDFRLHVEANEAACWNLSDYAVLCWLSVGGRVADLKALWKAETNRLDESERLVLSVLKEKTTSARADAAKFVELTRAVAVKERVSA